jgi:hypothetical protein
MLIKKNYIVITNLKLIIINLSIYKNLSVLQKLIYHKLNFQISIINQHIKTVLLRILNPIKKNPIA